MTYPQLPPTTLDTFTSYFFSGGTVIVGLVSGADETEEEGEIADMQEVSLEEMRSGRDWKNCLGGFFYVKPNYPGRSSFVQFSLSLSLFPLPLSCHVSPSLSLFPVPLS